MSYRNEAKLYALLSYETGNERSVEWLEQRETSLLKGSRLLLIRNSFMRKDLALPSLGMKESPCLIVSPT